MLTPVEANLPNFRLYSRQDKKNNRQGLFQGGPGGAFAPPWDPFAPLGIGFSVLLIWGCPSLALYLAPLEFWNLAFAPSEAKS